VTPVVADDVVLEALVAVEVAERLAGAVEDAVLDRPRLRGVGVLVLEEGLPAGQVLAVEQRSEAFLGLLLLGERRRDDDERGAQAEGETESHRRCSSGVGCRPAHGRPGPGSAIVRRGEENGDTFYRATRRRQCPAPGLADGSFWNKSYQLSAVSRQPSARLAQR